MLAAATPIEVPPDLKTLVPVILILAQIIKQIPPVKLREDWLVPLLVIGMSLTLACLQLQSLAILDGLFLGVACLGAFKVLTLPFKIGKTPE